MRKLSIFNRKGGVGKTIIAANLAYELARKGYMVLVTDLDGQCDLTEFLLNSAPAKAKSKKTVLDVLNNDCLIEKAYINICDNLYLLPGSRDIESFSLKFSQQALKDKLMSKGMKDFDYVIIDNPPSITPAVECGLVAADYVVVVTEAENPAIDNLDKLNKEISKFTSKLNPGLSILGIILNKVDMRRNITKRNIAILESKYPDLLFETYISIDTGIPNSINAKIPIRNLRWRSRTLSQIQRLLNDMLQRIAAKEGANE